TSSSISSSLNRCVPKLEFGAYAAAAIIDRQRPKAVDTLQRSHCRGIERRYAARLRNPHVRRRAIARNVEGNGNRSVRHGVRINFILQPVLREELRHLAHVICVAAAEIPAGSHGDCAYAECAVKSREVLGNLATLSVLYR